MTSTKTFDEQAPLLDVRSLSVSFETPRGHVTAVDDVSLRLDSGAMVCIVGESGAGKSVLARSIMRLTPKFGVATTGQVFVGGVELSALSERQMRDHWGPTVSMVFQDPMTALNPVMKVGDQIEEGMRVHGSMSRQERRAETVRLLRTVGIPEPDTRRKQYPHQLSGGMRQRVMIAIAMAQNPMLLMADEPTTALDVTIQAQVMELLKREQERRKMGVVLVTHDLGVAQAYAHRIVVMYAGQIVETATTGQLFAATRSPYTLALRSSIPRLEDEPHQLLAAIPGRQPNLTDLPKGCRFAPRCRFAQETCLEDPVPLVEDAQDPGHYVRCRYPAGTPAGDAALERNLSRGVTATGLPVTRVDGEVLA